MEELNKKRQQLLDALATLADAIEILSTEENNRLYQSLRDSLIHRFEYSIDSFWKFLKLFLEEKLLIIPKLDSPRPIIRDAKTAGIITEQEANILIQCIADRNLTSHTYREQVSIEIASHVLLYYKTMKEIVDKLSDYK